MPEKVDYKKETAIPVVPVREVAVFPFMIAPVIISREVSIKALEVAMDNMQNEIVLLAQKDPYLEYPASDDLYDCGVLSKIIQVLKFPDGAVKAIIEGISRVKIETIEEKESIYFANISQIEEIIHENADTKALIRLITGKFEDYARKNNRMSSENLIALASINNEPGRLADIIATFLEVEGTEKQQVLEIQDTSMRLEMMNGLLEREIEMLGIEEIINNKLKKNLSKTQKEFYLKEKLKIIKEELYGTEDIDSEISEYKAKVEILDISDKHRKKLYKEINRLEKLPDYSSEMSVIRTYLDRVINLPWNEKTEDINDISRARKVLDADHWGLEEAKERILEFLAVRQLTEKPQATIICFEGPPGVGKTSLARSIARSLGRKFSYISLGGINDESEIRGHRRTYIGSMPGRIIQAVENAGTKNPVILLDEIEKMMRSHMGDPTAAMLEVLDPEQNKNFTDHYVDMPFDLSEVFFVATANNLDTVYKALKDRLEVIKLSGYTEDEKLNIAKYFLVPKQLYSHGIKKSKLNISETAIHRIINEYTREAGVRNLERSIAKICRKSAMKIVNEENQKIRLSNKNLEEYLGVPRYTSDDKRKDNEIGVINGLAWTEYGGDVLYIEATVMPGKGNLNLTGSLGDVMQESAKAALGYIRSNHKQYRITPDIAEKQDIHVHVPDGATPKDGPSAGLAISLAIISALTDKPIRADVAITGEITLRGRVLPIGGVKEKVLSAIRNGIFNVIIPAKNCKNVLDLPENIREKVNFIYVSTIDEAAKEVFKKG
jgi:ATP-dependent Lon protease